MHELSNEQKEFLKRVIPKHFDHEPPDYQGFFKENLFDTYYEQQKDFYHFFESLGFEPLKYMNETPSALFYYDDSLKIFKIPNSITSISDSTFYDCKNLESIKIPSSVTCINIDAFWNCKSLKSIKIPESVVIIGDYSFWNCRSLKSIKIPNSVTTIGKNAFYECENLKSIEIPKRFKDVLSDIGIDTNITKVKFI